MSEIRTYRMKKLSFKRKYLAMPYAVLLVVFIIIPLFIVVLCAFNTASVSAGGSLFSKFKFGFANFVFIFKELNAFGILLKSLLFALASSAICLFIAYPLAYFLSNKNYNKSAVMVMLFVMPMWINFLIRMLAVKNIFTFVGLHLSYGTALIGNAYDFLPFMILPIYTTLANMDKSLVEASQDLGASPFRTFLRVTLPLSVPGILSGVIMVFMPTVSSFAVPKFLGRDLTLFGTMINKEIGGTANNWGFGASLSIIMLILVGLSVFAANKFAKKRGGITDATAGGMW